MVACDPGSTSRMVDADCGVHLMIEDATVETSQYGTSIKAKFSILAATDSTQVGKSVTEFFQTEGKAVDKLYNLAEAIGIITAEQRKAATDQGMGLDIDETLFKGRQLCGEVKMEPNLRKKLAAEGYEVDPTNPGPYPRLGFRTFAVDSKKAEKIPKDQQFIAMLAGTQGPVSRPPQPPSQQQQSAPPPPPPATSDPSMNW